MFMIMGASYEVLKNFKGEYVYEDNFVNFFVIDTKNNNQNSTQQVIPLYGTTQQKTVHFLNT